MEKYQQFAKEKLGFEFKDINLLVVALTHRSYVNEHKSAHEHNERLEFLGDAVLGFVSAEFLYRSFPNAPEGDLTRTRAALVREESLFEAAAEGCHPLLITASDPMGGMAFLCRDHPILFNTVPSHILPRDLLMGLQPDTLLIDLASAPFGVSDTHVREAAEQNGLRYLRAPSLPGSYAPRDAGRAIAECSLGMVTHRDSSDETNREGGTPT